MPVYELQVGGGSLILNVAILSHLYVYRTKMMVLWMFIESLNSAKFSMQAETSFKGLILNEKDMI